ncbi:MAG: cytochrome c3 family protein, partial [Betaproteobacteria bacterium]
MSKRIVAVLRLLAACMLLLAGLWGAQAQTGTASPRDPRFSLRFDHVKTGFPLSGQHAQVRCESCHTGGMFKGTPRNCTACHVAGGRASASAKPVSHIPTTETCDTCHRANGWTPAVFSHNRIAPGSCVSCHNGTVAKGKPSAHIATTVACDTCHRTSSWTPASFSHSAVAPGSCQTCHNDSTAKGKPAGHVTTSAACDTCHRTTAWTPATVSHSSVAAGT